MQKIENTVEKKHHEFSPSKLQQMYLCPGSWKMQRGLADKSGPAALEGTAIHEAIATKKLDRLNQDQQILAEKAIEYLESRHQKGDQVELEEHIHVYDDDGQLLTEGTADVVIIHADHTITVIDWKFGWNRVPGAYCNLQLAAYCLGAMQRHHATSCEGVIFQPRLKVIDRHTFLSPENILRNIRNVISLSRDFEGVDLRPSEYACRYCLASSECPAFRMKLQGLDLKREIPRESDALAELYRQSRETAALCDRVEKAVRARLDETGECGVYRWHEVPGRREVRDIPALWARVKDVLTEQEFHGLCSVTYTRLETLLADKLLAAADARGEKLSAAAARKQAGINWLAPVTTHGAPTKKIVELA